jgi:starvation-inducible outer membrane lipoprotein
MRLLSITTFIIAIAILSGCMTLKPSVGGHETTPQSNYIASDQQDNAAEDRFFASLAAWVAVICKNG